MPDDPNEKQDATGLNNSEPERSRGVESDAPSRTDGASAAEVVGFNEPIPFDRGADTVEPKHPEFVWVLLPAESLPVNGVTYVAFSEGAGPNEPRRTGLLPTLVRPRVARVIGVGGGAGAPRARVRGTEGLAEEPESTAHPKYFDQHTSPLPKRRYLALAREKAFPAFKVGKQVLALRTDVEEFIASRAVMGRPSPPAPPPDEVDDVLARAGLQRKR